jgi:hypothetical protein
MELEVLYALGYLECEVCICEDTLVRRGNPLESFQSMKDLPELGRYVEVRRCVESVKPRTGEE